MIWSSPSGILPITDQGRKTSSNLLIPIISFFIGINSDLARICPTTSLHRFKPVGKEIMKLIKFHTSFITPCFLPFANLSKSSVLYPTSKEVHVNAHKPKERALGWSDTGRSTSRGLTSFTELQAPMRSTTRFSNMEGLSEKALDTEASYWDSVATVVALAISVLPAECGTTPSHRWCQSMPVQ